MNLKNYLKGILIDADLLKNPNYIFFQKFPKNPIKWYWKDIEKNPIGLLFFPVHFIFFLFIFLWNFVPVSLRIIDTFVNRKNWNSNYSKKEIKKLWSAGVSLEELKALENIGFSRKMVRAWMSLGYNLYRLKALETEDFSSTTIIKKFHEKRDLYYIIFFYRTCVINMANKHNNKWITRNNIMTIRIITKYKMLKPFNFFLCYMFSTRPIYS